MRALAWIGVLALLVAVSGLALAQQPPAQKAPEKSSITGADLDIKFEVYTYKSEKNRDPFFSIIERAKQQKTAPMSGETSPLQMHDISQVRVVAILKETAKSYALISLPDKKFYTVYKNTRIGIHEGWIMEITQDAIVVREKVKNFKDEVENRDTFLRLRPEGVK